MNGSTITVSKGGKVCTPQEILTVARSAKRGLLLEVVRVVPEQSA